MACFLRPDKVETSVRNRVIKHKEPQTAENKWKEGKPDGEM